MKALATLVLSVVLMSTPVSVEARVIEIRHYENRDLCLVTHDLEDGSKLKVAKCDDPYQVRMSIQNFALTTTSHCASNQRPRWGKVLCCENVGEAIVQMRGSNGDSGAAGTRLCQRRL